ncbi:MAG: DUF4363 family protein [Clostridia bacterium]|nr:DUF4363 family protein [Clostridia bacterium]
MKKFVVSFIVFFVLLSLIIFHSVSMLRLGENIDKLCNRAEKLATAEKWEEAEKTLKEIRKKWEEKSIWTSLTIETDELEQIEVSLRQSEKYAKLRDKEKFVGEFTMFSTLVEHIPHHEGFHIEEIL